MVYKDTYFSNCAPRRYSKGAAGRRWIDLEEGWRVHAPPKTRKTKADFIKHIKNTSKKLTQWKWFNKHICKNILIKRIITKIVVFAYYWIAFIPKRTGHSTWSTKKLGRLNLCVIPQRRYTNTKNNYRLKLKRKKDGVESPQILVIKYKITSYFKS